MLFRSVRVWHIKASRLLSREREYPNDAPTWEEMGLWFGVCLLVFGGAALGTVLILGAVKRLLGTPILFSIAFVLGLIGPNVLSALVDRCLFTWPVSLYIAFHAALSAYAWTEHAASPCRARWWARLAGALFLLVVYLYYEACKTVGMYIFWSFLIGFLPAFPLAFLAVRAQTNSQTHWLTAAWIFLAFGVFFWSCQGMFLWKTSQAD